MCLKNCIIDLTGSIKFDFGEVKSLVNGLKINFIYTFLLKTPVQTLCSSVLQVCIQGEEGVLALKDKLAYEQVFNIF